MKRTLFYLVIYLIIFVVLAFCSAAAYSHWQVSQINKSQNPYNVYLSFGFHLCTKHSWRGDALDETGFGVNIRVIREIIEILNEANEQGIPVRGTWNIDSGWTIEEYLKKYAPDILESIKKRVHNGLDEVIISPYNNGLVAAATEKEFVESIKRAFTNDEKSGLVDIFGEVTPMVRPQEMMFTPGHIRLYRELGIEYLSLYYSSTPFNSISNFIPLLTTEQRHNPIYLKDGTSDDKIILIPTYHHGDLLSNYSLRKWLIELRKEQISGKVKSDLLVFINTDADAETWVGFGLPPFLSFIPNFNGLREAIRSVQDLEFVKFTTIKEYMKNRSPRAEVVVTQDLADGGWDGFSSWAEKLDSHYVWTDLEKSRYYTHQADYLLENEIKDDDLKKKTNNKLWGEGNSSFINRLDLLSTTFYGMSTPVINAERLKQAFELSNLTKEIAYNALRECKKNIVRKSNKDLKDYLYAFYIFNFKNRDSKMFAKVPLILPENINLKKLKLFGENNREIPFSIIDIEKKQGKKLAHILFYPELKSKSKELFFIKKGEEENQDNNKRAFSSSPIELEIDENGFITSLKHKDREFAKEKFILPFVNYDNKIISPKKFTVENLEGEILDGLQRIKLKGEIEIIIENKKYPVELQYIFTLTQHLPYVFVDVEVEFPRTPTKKFPHTMVQKINRSVDLNWIEVAPFQLQPAIFSSENDFLRIWKINYLNHVSSYELNYKKINPKNANLASFNNHITAPWVAVSNGIQGLLISQNAQILSNFAFAPMRLKEIDGIQNIFINPFGTYYGKQLDYSHLSENDVGVEVATAVAPFLNSTAPSFNGGTLNFALMLAPYEGDKPPKSIQNDAMDFFHPSGIIYLKTPFLEKEIIDTGDILPEEEDFYIDEAELEPSRKIPPLSEIRNLSITTILKLLWSTIKAMLTT